MDRGFLHALRRFYEAHFVGTDLYCLHDLSLFGLRADEREHASASSRVRLYQCRRSLHEYRHQPRDGLYVQLLQSGMAVGRESELWRTGVVSDGAYNLLRIIAGIFGRMA